MLPLFYPGSRVVHEPFKVRTKEGNTLPDISFSLPGAEIVVLVEVTTRSLTSKDPKANQRKLLGLFEKFNDKYRSAVLYKQHFQDFESVSETFAILGKLALDEMKTYRGHEELNRIVRGRSHLLFQLAQEIKRHKSTMP